LPNKPPIQSIVDIGNSKRDNYIITKFIENKTTEEAFTVQAQQMHKRAPTFRLETRDVNAA
jgi:hypothetical protein